LAEQQAEKARVKAEKMRLTEVERKQRKTEQQQRTQFADQIFNFYAPVPADTMETLLASSASLDSPGV